ncbi:RNA polymerase sigma factor [Rudanella lutea]|uniref:RNA polymerase sigma factor n=1 Tax=Rudanella lutea TaxID=451374 RepID=UPI00035C41F3|nr:sigma-70 family RNA polymerase sigma factor [Rudanella lutea]
MRFSAQVPSDAQWIDELRAGGIRRRQAENRLYDQYAYFIREGARKHRLDEEQTATAYADALLALIDQVVSGRFEGRSSLKTYLYSLFSNKCVDQIRRKTTNRESVHGGIELDGALLQLPDESRSVVQQLIAQYDAGQLRQRLRLLGEKCQSMLLAWGDGFSDEDIALQQGYNSSAVAKTSRLRCLEKLRELYRT